MASREQQLELQMPVAAGTWQRIKGWYASQQSNLLYDRQLLLIMLALAALGLVMVTSASMPVGERLTGNPFYFMLRHGMYMAFSLVVAGVVLTQPMSRWEQMNGWLCLAAIVMLIAVLFVGHTVNAATRWIRIGPMTLQVAEFAKLFFFVFLASYLHRRHDEVRKNLKGFFKALILLGFISMLLLLQPDLGTVVVVAMTSMGMLFLAGARIMQFFAVALTLLIALLLLIIIEPYRMRRVTSFWSPWDDPFGSGYQLTQSLMAFGRGDWFGQGLGNSVQKLQYLPEAHTDFIISIMAEELGFIGVVVTVLLLFALVVKALFLGQRALRQKRPFSGYLAHGIGIWFGFQTMVNVGAAAGLIPTKGLTIPFISYGGSSLLAMTIALAILLRIDYELRVNYRDPGQKPVSRVRGGAQ
ncbi:cell division protein FtsW [Aliidiomarina maris]|uniref:Probable peptidoglycan glycosyltransferase FtsW n=1 Tax=Aliidiomarina maris TaxID=531312 RepID=A0A327WPT4_9GAMM|nr:cell division protein FtsW [Aliidiomarina maris]MCL5050413.1 cell division protein FtsW [Bacillota bacterium]RAJ93920.1 cell division protein FtsW [Aliidiomarina maris]RUO27569.1 cell division protein FtsW [Aliidiomarina maris]